MWSPILALVSTSFGLTVVAQTLTLTFPNGPTVVQVFTTNANGLPTRTTIATLSGSTTPTSSPSGPRSTSSASSSIPSGTGSPPSATGSSTHPKARGIPASVIAGVLVAVIVLIALAFALALFFIRRRKQRRWRRSIKVELDPVGSPVVDKSFMPDPFVTDTQARGMGYDTSQQPTRRLEAKFLPMDQGGFSESSNNYATPRIIVTREGETTGRPITPSSSGHHTHSLTGHTPSTQYALEKSARGPSGASRDPLGEGPSSTNATTTSPSQAELALRMRDLLAQMEQHATSPVSDSGVAVVRLQRQVEILQRENEELRSTGAEAPPAYQGDGRF